MGGRRPVIRAAIDVGSNSVLLVVAERKGGSWRVLAETSEVTGLGRDALSTGVIGADGASETLNALERAFGLARSIGAKDIRAAGTAALRIASNRLDFLRAASGQGTPVDVLSGDEEAALGFAAVADDPLFACAGKLSIIDPGGHSTELLTAARRNGGWRERFRRSFSIGALGLREGILAAETPDVRARVRALAAIDDALGLRYLPDECGTAVVLGATGVNLVSIREGLERPTTAGTHGQALDYEEVSRAVGSMCDLDDAGRAALRGIEPGRERTLHVGAIILERFLFAIGAESCVVSARGWRHALLERDE